MLNTIPAIFGGMWTVRRTDDGGFAASCGGITETAADIWGIMARLSVIDRQIHPR